jgi:hypothetical protein
MGREVIYSWKMRSQRRFGKSNMFNEDGGERLAPGFMFDHSHWHDIIMTDKKMLLLLF